MEWDGWEWDGPGVSWSWNENIFLNTTTKRKYESRIRERIQQRTHGMKNISSHCLWKDGDSYQLEGFHGSKDHYNGQKHAWIRDHCCQNIRMGHGWRDDGQWDLANVECGMSSTSCQQSQGKGPCGEERCQSKCFFKFIALKGRKKHDYGLASCKITTSYFSKIHFWEFSR